MDWMGLTEEKHSFDQQILSFRKELIKCNPPFSQKLPIYLTW